MKKLLFTLALAIPALTFAQATYQPQKFKANEEVEITLTYQDLEVWYQNELYNLIMCVNDETITHKQFHRCYVSLFNEYKTRKKGLKVLAKLEN